MKRDVEIAVDGELFFVLIAALCLLKDTGFMVIRLVCYMVPDLKGPEVEPQCD